MERSVQSRTREKAPKPNLCAMCCVLSAAGGHSVLAQSLMFGETQLVRKDVISPFSALQLGAVFQILFESEVCERWVMKSGQQCVVGALHPEKRHLHANCVGCRSIQDSSQLAWLLFSCLPRKLLTLVGLGTRFAL